MAQRNPTGSAPITRRHALRGLAATLAAPMVFRAHGHAAPSETVRHASFGAGGMALADINSLTASKNLKLVAIADIDSTRFAEIKRRFPGVNCYQDWRELLDREKGLDSANISTPDHMHAPITMTAMQRGLHVYTQKPLTQTIHESRQLTRVAAEKKLVTQMGIQIHSHVIHRTVVALVQEGAIGKVREIHSWSGKQWGDRNPRPARVDMPPASLNWDAWLGVAAERPFITGYYHPGEWRKRLDFGTGTFGDMGCHILDPVFTATAVGNPLWVESVGDAPNADSWGLDVQVKFVFPGTKFTADQVSLTWYNGSLRPPAALKELVGGKNLHDQGSIYIGEKGVLYSPYIDAPRLFPKEKFEGYKMPEPGGNDHYLQFVEAVRGNGQTSAPFSFAGPLTESVLLGCLATRFKGQKLQWDGPAMRVTNVPEANAFVRRTYRKGWEVQGL